MSAATASNGLLAPGTQLGRYQVVRLLAVGGMAEIYLARATGIAGFEKTVVLKRIIPRLAQNPEFVEMFLDEARLTATLTHPNVVQVHDVDRIGENYFFTMEFVQGKDLRSVLERCATEKRGLTLPLALHIVIEVAAGLHYAHDKKGKDGQPLGTVHRDVSPGNVMITFDGQVKIVDFGIAKAAARQSKTKTGTVKGTVLYMSPEQAQGIELDRRSDVFSLGVLLYELTTGTRPFRAQNELAVLHKLVYEDVPAPSARRREYPPELERIVLKALARDKQARYATADELRRDLTRFVADQGLAGSQEALGELMRELFGERESVDAMAAFVPTEAAPAKAPAPHTATPTASVVIPMQRSRAWLGLALGAALVAALAGWFIFGRGELAHVGAAPSGENASIAPAPAGAPSATVAPSASEASSVGAAPPAPVSAVADAAASSEAPAPTRAPTREPRHDRVKPAPSPSAKGAPKWNLDSPLPP